MLPILQIDDEYMRYINVLESVLYSSRQNYVVVEVGARYGTWGARALAAWAQKHSLESAMFIGV